MVLSGHGEEGDRRLQVVVGVLIIKPKADGDSWTPKMSREEMRAEVEKKEIV